MFNFFLKRGFVNDVFGALERCYDEAAADNTIIQGFASNVRVPYVHTITRWLAHEGQQLDAEECGSLASLGSAIHRCRVWVGVHLAKEAYEWGALHVEPAVIREFWAPANAVSNYYLVNLRERRPEPFLSSLEAALRK